MLELHHVNILTPDVEGSIALYQEKLGMKVVARFWREGQFDLAIMRGGPASTEFAIEFVGPPFVDWMKEMFEGHGPMMDHLSFLVDDVDEVDAWHERLKARGVEILMPPTPFLTVKAMYCRDPCGAIVELIAYLDPSSAHSARDVAPSAGREYRFHHLSITCHDIPAVERFYVKELGLKTVREFREDGYIFVADPAFVADRTRAAPTLEILGPPGIAPREAAFLARYGPGIDHLCFTVDDVDAAYEELAADGVHFDLEPVDHGEIRMAFFKDPNGVDIELFPPLPRDVLAY
jgi:catechol 2,3-dioxygenase-like lactoylglutathione lyase family enzyme